MRLFSMLLAAALPAVLSGGCKSNNPAPDPHANHGTPTKNQDPHDGHLAPAGATHTASGTGPHAGHAMPSASAATLGYTMRVEPVGAVTAGATGTLNIHLLDSGGMPVERLQVVHEKKLHFLVISRDLAFFAHEHPQQQPGGLQTLAFSFPRPGDYVLFGDYTPEGASQVVSSARLTVPGVSAMREPQLKPDDLAHARRFGAFEVKLDQKVNGEESVLTFSLTRGGKPVADLQPYLGALGHLVLVDPGASKLLHSHPLGAGEPGKVSFHTAFPAPGLYKLWAEFRPEGQPLRADFVIESTGAGGKPHAH
jgi:hypothetical protein